MVVGDHDGRDAVLVALPGQQFHDFAAAGPVQRGGRFIHEEEFRPRDECPCDANALPFAAGELAGAVGGTVGHANGFQQDRRVEILRSAREPVDQAELIRRSQRRDEVAGLENEANVRQPERGAFAPAQLGEILPVDADRSGIRGGQGAGDGEQGGFAGTGRADDG